MKRLNLVIQNETGLHARPAKALVKLAKTFQSNILVQHGEKEVNAKSMIGVLKLGVKKSGEITVLIDGEDENEAAVQIETAVSSGLGEKTGDHKPNGRQKEIFKPTAVPTGPTNQLTGVSASPGIAIGQIFQLKRQTVIEEQPFAGVFQEIERLQEAIQKAHTKIKKMKSTAQQTLSAEEAAIFEAHLEILHDPDLNDGTKARIKKSVPAGSAWQQSVEEQAAYLSSLEDQTLAARAVDVRDVGSQVQQYLSANGEGVSFPERPFILVADDLTPSETVALDRDKVLGFCTSAGGPTAHSAILARALRLPAVVGLGEALLALANDTQIILNGTEGLILTTPTPEQLASAKSKYDAIQKQRAIDEAAAAEQAVTQDGHRVEVVANIGSPAEATQAYELGAEGVGLLRTEFLFLGQEAAPSEEKQYDVYRQIVEAMPNQPVIVRTLDIGGDKPVPYIEVEHEANPFLGERGIRLCLNRPELFKSQLRAIVRAAAHGRILIMFPMVSDVTELKQARQLVDEVRAELNADAIELGMMIEVPAAAMMADKFAPHLDFFSIGTNDLTQYTLAIDRQHPNLSRLSDGLHPAVLRLIDKTVRAAHEAGKWVGVCGELAADKCAAPILVGLGVDELSVNMNAIPGLKAQIRQLSHESAKQLAQKALDCDTAVAVRALDIE